LKPFLKGSQIALYENLKVEWVGGMAPTAYFKNDAGEVLKELELQDQTFEELVAGVFAENNFTPKLRVTKYEDPVATFDFWAGHHYELYSAVNNYELAKEFARSRSYNGESGYILTITSIEENNKVQMMLKDAKVPHAWLSLGDFDEGEWIWTEGPEKGTKIYQGRHPNGTAVEGAFVNWKEGEPNDADDEDCATVEAETGKWNDARCFMSYSALIVEYGSQPIEIPKTSNDNKDEL
jgi:hypothetical protein